MKPYQQIPILDCGEPLLPIPIETFALQQPHVYVAAGAPYGDKSPYWLRRGVLERLHQAQDLLQKQRSGWRIQIFDAYRPIAVQRYMVNYTFAEILSQRNLTIDQVSETEQLQIWDQVYRFWAVPSDDPKTPPPHSTGAAIDVTLVDETGAVVEMGSAIDELSIRSYPNHFADPAVWKVDNPRLTPSAAAAFHADRQLLKQIMQTAGFLQHPGEWWHFSWGDQFWTWQMQQQQAERSGVACYGRV